MWWWFPRFGIDCKFSTSEVKAVVEIVSQGNTWSWPKKTTSHRTAAVFSQGKPLLSSGTLCRRASFCIHSSLGSNGFTEISPNKKSQGKPAYMKLKQQKTWKIATVWWTAAEKNGEFQKSPGSCSTGLEEISQKNNAKKPARKTLESIGISCMYVFLVGLWKCFGDWIVLCYGDWVWCSVVDQMQKWQPLGDGENLTVCYQFNVVRYHAVPTVSESDICIRSMQSHIGWHETKRYFSQGLLLFL